MTGGYLATGVATGLLASGHCAGMCGTLAAALSLSGSRRAGALFHLLYNAGRIVTYGALGWAVGAVGLAVAQAPGVRGAGRLVLLGADAFVIAVGLATAARVRGLDAFGWEARGIARLLSRAVAGLRRLPGALGAFPLGLALGLLPCGLLYAVLLTGALTSDPRQSSALLVGFGVGTAPALLAFAALARLVGARARAWMVRGAGLAVAFLGAYNLARHLSAGSCH